MPVDLDCSFRFQKGDKIELEYDIDVDDPDSNKLEWVNGFVVDAYCTLDWKGKTKLTQWVLLEPLDQDIETDLNKAEKARV